MTSEARYLTGTFARLRMGYLNSAGRQSCLEGTNTIEHTSNVVRQLQRRLSFRDIHVKHVIVLDSVVDLLPAGTDGIRHFADLLPCSTSGRPL